MMNITQMHSFILPLTHCRLFQISSLLQKMHLLSSLPTFVQPLTVTYSLYITTNMASLAPPAGPRAGKWALIPFQVAVLVGIALTYTVLGGQDLHQFIRHVNPSGAGVTMIECIILFGALQILLSMVSAQPTRLSSLNRLREEAVVLWLLRRYYPGGAAAICNKSQS